MLRRLLIVSLTSLALSGSTQSVKVEKYTLPNGMTVILQEDHTLPTVTINTWFRVGSKDEPDRRSGFAHLFEHLMFMGTKRVPTGQFDTIMETGGGSNNASTAQDRTNYYSSGPANLLPLLLWLDADRLEALGKNIDQAKLNLQRDVVKNERRESTDNAPYGKAYEAIDALMFPKGHPYSTSVIGSMEDLDNASVKDVQDFFTTYYSPNNASLVVAGDFDPKQVKPLIEKWFGSLPRASDPPRKLTAQLPPLGLRRMTMTDQVTASKTIMVWHAPIGYSQGDIDMELTAGVLSNGPGSRLYRRLVTEKKLASEVSAYQESRLLGSLFYVEATLAEGASQDELEREIDAVLAEYAKNGPTDKELKRQVAQSETEMLSDLQRIESKADMLNEFEFYFGEPNSFERVMNMLRNASPAAVRDTAGRTLDSGSRLILRVTPQSPVAAGSNPREERPEVGAEASFKAPAPEKFTLSNGIVVRHWQRPNVPLTVISTRMEGGADRNPVDRAGLASLTAELLTEGAGDKGSIEFHEQLELLGASVSAGASRRKMQVTLEVSTRQLRQALELYADAILRPRFEPSELERVKRVTLAGLEQRLDEPSTVASLAGAQQYFGSGHPYALPTSGTKETVGRISREDVLKEYRATFQPQNATILTAGSLSASEVKAELERALGAWKPAQAKPTQIAYPAPKNTALRVVLVDRPDAVQTVIRFLMPAPTYSDPTRLKREAIATLFGGAFTSRLNANLREAKGYTYGIGSSFSLDEKVGWFSIRTSVRADVTGASLKEVLAELRKVRAGDISQDEALKAARSMRVEQIAALGSLGGLVSLAAQLLDNGRELNELDTDIAALARLDAASLNALVKEALPLERAVIVLVGDRKVVLPQLEGLGLPKVEIVSFK